ESPPRDLADQVARDRNVTLVSHYMPAMGILCFNQLYGPFDKPEARRALLSVVDQAEAMTVVARTGLTGWTASGCSRTTRRWPTSPRIEELRRAWLDAGDIAEQRRIAAELQMQVWQDVPFIPMGEYWQTTAYRKNIAGVIPGCFTVFWGVKRT